MMINEFDCLACEGKGKIANPHIDMLDPPPPSYDDCSVCMRVGRVQLAVITSCVDDSVSHSSTVIVTPEGPKCPRCGKLTIRPLTDDEVRELIGRHKPTGTTQYNPIELMMDNIKRGILECKGSQVKLIPMEEG